MIQSISRTCSYVYTYHYFSEVRIITTIIIIIDDAGPFAGINESSIHHLY